MSLLVGKQWHRFNPQRLIFQRDRALFVQRQHLYGSPEVSSAGALTTTFQYAYDAVGNRTVQTRTVGSVEVITYTYDAANRLTFVETLSGIGDQGFTWDDNGNLMDDGRSYTYDQANRLIEVQGSGIHVTFAYNGEGVRLSQVIAGVPTTYTQDLAAPLPIVIQSQTGANVMQYVYALGTRPLAQNGGAWEYLLPDALGSMRQIVDANGKVTLAKSYEPYGSVLTSTGTASSIFGYAGEQADTYIKLLFLRARYYSPETARFLSKDVWPGDYTRPQSFNGWTYVEGDPINHVDPTGQWWCRPSPNTPSCEDWVESALDTLKNAGPQGENMWSNFDRIDSTLLLQVGIFFVPRDKEWATTDSLGIYQMEFPLRWLNDAIPSETFDRHVALLGHEIWHLVTGPKIASVQREVDAYVRQGFVTMELGYDMPEISQQLYDVAWEPEGHVSTTYEKLCPAKKLLFEYDDEYKNYKWLTVDPYAFVAVCAQYCLE